MSICVYTTMISAYQLSGIFHMEKGACDCLGGTTVKRLAARASLQRPYNDQIMTPRQLFDWAVPSVHFGYCSMEDYEREQHNLERCFHQSRTIPGTRKLHSFVPISKGKVRVSYYSVSDTSREERVILRTNDLPPESIVGFVTCLCDWPCVLQIIQECRQVKVTFLHPHGPSRISRLYQWITLVDPRTRTGRVYTLKKLQLLLKGFEF